MLKYCWHHYENYKFKITATFPWGQWVKNQPGCWQSKIRYDFWPPMSKSMMTLTSYIISWTKLKFLCMMFDPNIQFTFLYIYKGYLIPGQNRQNFVDKSQLFYLKIKFLYFDSYFTKVKLVLKITSQDGALVQEMDWCCKSLADPLITVSRLYGLYRHLYTQLIYWHCAVILYTHVNLLLLIYVSESRCRTLYMMLLQGLNQCCPRHRNKQFSKGIHICPIVMFPVRPIMGRTGNITIGQMCHMVPGPHFENVWLEPCTWHHWAKQATSHHYLSRWWPSLLAWVVPQWDLNNMAAMSQIFRDMFFDSLARGRFEQNFW